MNRPFTTILAAIAQATLSVVSMQASAQSDDAFRGAYERMLDHSPATPAAVTQRDLFDDPLHHVMVLPLREWASAEAARPTESAMSADIDPSAVRASLNGRDDGHQ